MTALRAGIWTCLDPGGTSRIGPGNPGWELARMTIAPHRPGSRGGAESMRALKPASRLKEGAKRRNAPTTQRRIQLPVVAGRTPPPRHVPKVHGAQKERRMSEPAGTQLDRARTKRSGHSGAAPKRVAGQPAGEGGARIVLCRVCRLSHKLENTHTGMLERRAGQKQLPMSYFFRA